MMFKTFLPAVSIILTGVFAAACRRLPVPPMQTDVQIDGGQVLIGAGDIASCSSDWDEATAAVVDSLLVVHPDAVVFTAGDNAYEDGTAQEYIECYEPNWGRFRGRTWATIGNHEYHLGNADPTFDYFGERVGPRGLGYYSLDVGTWHLVMLNSNSSFVPVRQGSPQEEWLRWDLAINEKACLMAVFHHPHYHSSNTGSLVSAFVKPLWDALYDHGADVIVNGHNHNYERFAPQDPDGNLDPDFGIRQFIVGTGGGGGVVPSFLAPNSEVLNDERLFGVIKFTLYDESYEWEFIPVPGYSFSDSGSGRCHL